MQNTVSDCDCGIVDRPGCWRAVVVDRIPENGVCRIGGKQDRRSPPVVKVNVYQQGTERIADRRRIAHQVAERPESLQVEALTDQKAEVLAARAVNARFEQSSKGIEGDSAIGIVKKSGVNGGPGKCASRVDSKLGQDGRNCKNWPNPDIAGAAYERRAGWSPSCFLRVCFHTLQVPSARLSGQEIVWPEMQGAAVTVGVTLYVTVRHCSA